jgi:dTDP-glucose 4,6-dehydratase
MGKNKTDYRQTSERPGHDLRYSIDASKLINDLGWQPKFTDIKTGLSDTIDWYRQNPSWWKPQKNKTELKYQEAKL